MKSSHSSATPPAEGGALKQATFHKLQRLFAQRSGIRLADNKQFLVVARLRRRVEALGLPTFEAYCQYLEREGDTEEEQRFVDLLTVNETYFFREPQHFAFVHRLAKAGTYSAQAPLRVWSAASSTGEEAYSVAMTLLDVLDPRRFEVLASDLSTQVVTRARRAIYPLQRMEQMPTGYLQRFCLRGKDKYQGTLRISEEVKGKVSFFQHNLMERPCPFGVFDVVFLRNVLIYFEREQKQRILTHIAKALKPHAFLIVGRSESLMDLDLPLLRKEASIYQRVR